MAKKVGQKKEVEAEVEVEVKGRIDFPTKTAMYVGADDLLAPAVNADGLLIGVPKTVKDGDGNVTFAGFDLRKHKPLAKAAFADIATYLYHQAHIARLKAEKLLALADDKDAKAKRIEKYGDEATRKKAAKLARMREQLSALEEQCVAEGIDIEDI